MNLSHICKIIGHCHSGFRCRVSGVSSRKVRAGLKPCMKLHKIWCHFQEVSHRRARGARRDCFKFSFSAFSRRGVGHMVDPMGRRLRTLRWTISFFFDFIRVGLKDRESIEKWTLGVKEVSAGRAILTDVVWYLANVSSGSAYIGNLGSNVIYAVSKESVDRAVSRLAQDYGWQPLLQCAVLGMVNRFIAFTSFRYSKIF
jgi:hypothetical protein